MSGSGPVRGAHVDQCRQSIRRTLKSHCNPHQDVLVPCSYRTNGSTQRRCGSASFRTFCDSKALHIDYGVRHDLL